MCYPCQTLYIVIEEQTRNTRGRVSLQRTYLPSRERVFSN